MKKTKIKINEKIKELNKKCNSLVFEFVDGENYCSIENQLKSDESQSFGTYQYCSIDNEIEDKEAHYRECDAFLSGLLAGISLLDPKAYHNFLENLK